ncbi:MAG: tetratricopeptide repeat protein, partial [Elusimicrobia bacterium]|nr:tetratricopeptide repeat protein [Elusimicrobiota bacterium]
MKTLLVAAVLAVPASAQPDLPPPDAPAAAPAAEAAKAAEPAAAPAATPAPAAPAAEVQEAAPASAAVPAPKPEEPKVTVTAPKVEEVKPLPPEPKKEEAKPEPKPEPKAEPKKAAKAVGVEEEWAFAKAAAEDSDSGVQDAAADDLKLFVRRHPDAAQAPEALAALAAVKTKRGDWASALVAYLRATHEYPDSKGALSAKSAYLQLVDKKASRRQRAPLNDLVAPVDAPEKSDRLSAVWQKAAATAGDALYEPLAEEIRDFMVRFPGHADGDKLQAALARVSAANEKYAAAALGWRRLLALYPDSPLRPLALKSLGDVYADNLRDYKKAIDAYQQLIADHPQAPEVLAALESSDKLFEERLKQF